MPFNANLLYLYNELRTNNKIKNTNSDVLDGTLYKKTLPWWLLVHIKIQDGREAKDISV
jgi:hypothetical protein